MVMLVLIGHDICCTIHVANFVVIFYNWRCTLYSLSNRSHQEIVQVYLCRKRATFNIVGACIKEKMMEKKRKNDQKKRVKCFKNCRMMRKKGQQVSKKCHCVTLFIILPFFVEQKMSFLGFDGRKVANDGKKGGKRKKKWSLFFRHSRFAAANFWKRGARAKQDLDTAVITHSLSSLRIGTSLSKRHVFKATKSMSLPLPWTNAKH